MVDNNKILTVSYGTFSCTLEGFEDSFSTMKAIAEYFRDLASDDRYFGAEPPTPDAAMLARIAEREVSRHVDASVDGNDVVLRAAAPEAAQLEAPETQETSDAQDVAVEDAPKVKDRKAAKAAKAKRKHAKAKAEKAKRKRARQAEKAAKSKANIADAAPLADIDQGDAAQTEDPIIASETDSDSVAAKLARIRSVVTPVSDTSDGDIFSEDQHAADSDMADDTSFEDMDQSEETASDEDTDMASVLAALTQPDATIEAPEAETAEADFAIDTTAHGTDDNDASILNTLATLNLGTETRIDAPVDVAAPDTIADAAKPLARVVKVKRKDFEAALAAGGLEEVDDTETVVYDADISSDASNLDTITESVAETLGETTLSDEDEAELMAELAAVEQEVKQSTPPIDDVEDAVLAGIHDLTADAENDDEETALEDANDVQDAAQRLDPVGDADETVDRLLTKTQDEFDQPETGRRRNAIAHLKAAVAATRAERGAQGDLVQADDETDTYRDDLAQVVRPRRATASGRRSDRPVQKAPPLTLVAEQRIDLDTPDKEIAVVPSAPVRPRRVAKIQSRISDDDLGSFQEFADAQGASDLPDLLEAAAAYASYIKGQPTFTRPELMSKVMTLSEEEPHSREDSLRSFGQLLREGKIVKIKKGQFTVSEDTRFRPDTARFAGE